MNLYFLFESLPYDKDTILGVYDSNSNATKAFEEYATSDNQLNPTPSDITTLSEAGPVQIKNYYYNIREMELNQNEF